MPTDVKLQVSLLSRGVGGGWVGGGWGEIEIKAKLSPAESGVWAELGNESLKSKDC